MNEIIKRKFNIFILGETNIGKTALIVNLVGLPFDQNSITGTYDAIDDFKIEGKIYKFKIYDSQGQERYRQINFRQLKIADAFMIVFAIDIKETFKLIDLYLKEIEKSTDKENKPIYIVGNRIDLDKREVSKEEAMEFCKLRNVKYYETSAKTGFGVKKVFHDLYYETYDAYQRLKTLKTLNEFHIIKDKNEIKTLLEENKDGGDQNLEENTFKNKKSDINKNYISKLSKYYNF